MPTRTIYIDVDQTLVDINGNLLPGVLEKIEYLYRYGYTLICWSGGGHEYAQRVLEKRQLNLYFTHVLDKPDIIIDDNPDSVLDHAHLLTIQDKDSWNTILHQLFKGEVY